MDTLTLTPHITAFMTTRRALGIYGPKSQRVVAPRLHSLSKHFGRRPLSALTERAIGAWLGDLHHLAINSRASYLCSVRQFTAWLAEQNAGYVDPCLTIPAVKRARSIPRAQPADAIGRVLAACADDRERAIVHLMVSLGLRRMEVAALRWEHIDERSGVLLVISSKGAKERALPLVSEVTVALNRLRGGGTTGPVIQSHRDHCRGISAERVGAIASDIMSRAGVKIAAYDGASGHALRHTAASDVLDACHDLRVVQVMLGHEHLSTTAIYLRRASASQLREAMEGRTYEVEAA